MESISVLTVGSDQLFMQRVKKLLISEGYQAVGVSCLTGLQDKIRKMQPDLVILQVEHHETNLDLNAIHLVRGQDPWLPVVVVMKKISASHVLAVMRAGANDCLSYPCEEDELHESILRCLSSPFKSSQGHDTDMPLQHMVGNSRRITELKAYLKKVAASDSTLLITGETGTGKELAAAFVHQHSRRATKAFVCINCAALPHSLTESELFGFDKGAFTGAVEAKKGKFEQADGGTLFLDEIGDMSLSAQTKILRTIENKETYRLGGVQRIPLDIRVIAATNQDLGNLIKKGLFRDDLFYRLGVAQVVIPPLRERKEDLGLLIDYYINRANVRYRGDIRGFTRQAKEILFAYHWPGNVRELKNLIEAAFINLPCHPVAYMDLPELFISRLKSTRTLPSNERDRLLAALYATNWNKSKAAHKLRWSRMTLYRKMAKYNIANP